MINYNTLRLSKTGYHSLCKNPYNIWFHENVIIKSEDTIYEQISYTRVAALTDLSVAISSYKILLTNYKRSKGWKY